MLSIVTLQELERVYEKLDFTYEEFEEDVKRIYSITRAIRRYGKSGQLLTRQVVNQIVTVNNVFGAMGIHALEEDIGDDARIYLDTILYWLGRETNRVVSLPLYELLDREIK